MQIPESEPVSQPDWLTKRRRLDSLLRLQAAMLSGEPATGETIRVLADALTDRDSEVRELAAAALYEMGPAAAAALPELMTAIGDENIVVRRRAARVLGLLQDQADDVLAALINASDDPDLSVSLQAVSSLGELGSAAASAIPAIMAVFWTGDTRRRAIAGVALVRIGSPAVPALVQSLRHPSADIRCKAAMIIGRIGCAAIEAEATLLRMLESKDEGVRVAAGEALAAIRASQ
jgi:HEAT repeat protein